MIVTTFTRRWKLIVRIDLGDYVITIEIHSSFRTPKLYPGYRRYCKRFASPYAVYHLYASCASPRSGENTLDHVPPSSSHRAVPS